MIRPEPPFMRTFRQIVIAGTRVKQRHAPTLIRVPGNDIHQYSDSLNNGTMDSRVFATASPENDGKGRSPKKSS